MLNIIPGTQSDLIPIVGIVQACNTSLDPNLNIILVLIGITQGVEQYSKLGAPISRSELRAKKLSVSKE